MAEQTLTKEKLEMVKEKLDKNNYELIIKTLNYMSNESYITENSKLKEYDVK